MRRTFKVGIVGAGAGSGWARDAHVPAVRALEGLELAAVATGGRATAEAAERAFGVPGYAGGLDLVRDADVDIVAVCTRVPDHRDIVLAALAAGRHVYCEWPLGRGAAEAEEMAAAAAEAGVHVAIGLQLRASPALRRARDLVATGAIGRPLSLAAASTTMGFGPDVPAPFLYLEDPGAFANLVTIQGAHTLDLALALLGPLVEADALLTRQFPTIRAGEAGEARRRTTFDHMLVNGRLRSGAALSVSVAGGRGPATPFRLDVAGETGSLVLEGGAPRGLQAGRVRLSVDGQLQEVDEGELAGLPDAAANVGGVYARLRDDLRRGTAESVEFDHATRLTRLVSDLFLSSETGRRRTAQGWPES